MREKSAECHAHAGHVRGTTEMCSRDPPTLHSTLTKANGKNSNPQSTHHSEARIDNNLLPTPGGRLKFFKDGKFILELSHRRDGERTTWFPVPKKTFWPPASTTPNRQESSTSLSGKLNFYNIFNIYYVLLFYPHARYSRCFLLNFSSILGTKRN